MVDDFIIYITTEKRYSTHTTEAYRRDLTQFCRFLMLQYQIEDIKQANFLMIRSWIADLSESGNENKSIHRKISSLKSLYKWAIKKNILLIDPMEKLVRPKLKKRLAGIVQEREMNRVLANLNSKVETDFPGLRDDIVVSLLYHCGIRRAEIIDLTLNNINLSSKILKVRGKGSKERMIPFGDELLSKLLRYINKRKDLEYREGDYLILTNTGSKSYPKLIHRIVEKSLIGMTTIEQKSPHSLRHSFATHLADAGAEMNAIKSLMGHASLASTQFYTHLSVEKLKESYKAAHPSANL